MKKMPIYMDYMATTPVDPRVVEKMMQYMGPDGQYGNPASSTHLYGRLADQADDRAREHIAERIGGQAQEIVFTSGATEANNLAIIGAAQFYQRKGKHIITMVTEHKAVLDSFSHLETLGFEISWLKPQPNGLFSLADLTSAIRAEPILGSIL